MNKDQIKGRIKEVNGNIKEIVGRAVGNPNLEAEGAATKIAGKVEKNIGDIKHKIAEKIDS